MPMIDEADDREMTARMMVAVESGVYSRAEINRARNEGENIGG